MVAADSSTDLNPTQLNSTQLGLYRHVLGLGHDRHVDTNNYLSFPSVVPNRWCKHMPTDDRLHNKSTRST